MNQDPLNAFLSDALRKLAADGFEPESAKFEGALLFADISGFSKLARSFAKGGGEGAEQLTQLVNKYFDKLIGVLRQHGGDVVAFAGDAVLVVFRASDLREAVHRAAVCSLEIRDNLANYDIGDGIYLSIRVSIGAGPMQLAALGNEEQQQLMVVGSPLKQVRIADGLAQPGEVVLSQVASELLPENAVTEQIGEGASRLRNLLERSAPSAPNFHGVSADILASLRRFVPRAVLSRLDAGQTGWLAELRRVSVAFVRLDSIDTTNTDCIPELQTASRLVQTIVEQYDGTVVHLLADDKGTIAILAFGIPPNSPEQFAQRAIRATQRIVTELKSHQMLTSIGIATGGVFCGPLGSQHRRCFTLLGDVVNLAARLMQGAKGEILCDQQTHAECVQQNLARVPNHVVKGYEEPVPVFRIRRDGPAKIIGRDRELAAIADVFDADTASTTKTIVIEGAPGIGKSEIISNLIRVGSESGQTTIHGEASNVERSTPYFIMRSVLARVFGIDQSDYDQATSREKRITKFFSELAEEIPQELQQLLPLLNSILDTQFPPNAFVEQLTGERRTDNLHQLVLAILQRTQSRNQVQAIILDDVQWMDEASWKLTRALIHQLNDMRFVLVTRPLVEEPTAIFRTILDSSTTCHLAVGPLTKPDIVQLIQQVVGSFELDASFIEHVWSRCGGNPFFAKELTSFLTEADALVVRNGICQLNQRSKAAAAIPNSIRDVLAGRIGQLPQEVQLTAKTASVIGRLFQFKELEAIYPVERLRPELPHYVSDLRDHDLVDALRESQAEPMPTVEESSTIVSQVDAPTGADPSQKEVSNRAFCFSHITTQQVAYQQLPVAQRKQLHQEIANWYQAHPAARNQAAIANHLEKAENFDDAAEAFAKAGEFALRQGANLEAVNSLQKALGFFTDQRKNAADDQNESSNHHLWEAHYRRLLGEAFMHTGEIEKSRQQLELTLTLLGQPSPEGMFRNTLALMRLLIFQAFKRLFTRYPTLRKLTDEPNIGDVAHTVALANQRLAQIHYFTNDKVVGTARALRGLTTAERIDDSPGLARSYADLCIVHSLLRKPRLAERYATTAEQVARNVGDLPALAYVLNVTNMYRLSYAKFEAVEEPSRESVQIGLQLHCYRDRAESLTVMAMKHCFKGELLEGLVAFEQVGDVAKQGHNLLHQAWSHCGVGEARLRLGHYVRAEGDLRLALEFLQESTSATEELRAAGLLSLCLWQLNKQDEAVRCAVELANDYAKSPTASGLEGISSAMEVLC